MFAAYDCDVVEVFEETVLPECVGEGAVGVGFIAVLRVVGVVDEEDSAHAFLNIAR